MIGKTIREWVEPEHLLSYVEAILRVYNMQGRRDNIHKARIKIIVNQLGIETFRGLVEDEWARIRDSRLKVSSEEIDRVSAHFKPPPYIDLLPDAGPELERLRAQEPAFDRWCATNVVEHKIPGYSIVNVSLKRQGRPPGDLDADSMDAVAELADRYSFGEVRVTHRQNLVLTDVEQRELFDVWRALDFLGLASANIGQLTDIISCPGLDYCNLANARSIPVAEDISRHFVDVDKLALVGDLTLNISGCMNACGHHHVGNIGILGVDKRGEEYLANATWNIIFPGTKSVWYTRGTRDPAQKIY